MRRPEEIVFRLRQEIANLWMYAVPPSLQRPERIHMRATLAEPKAAAAAIAGTPLAGQIQSVAEGILRHHFQLLGIAIDTGPAIDWSRDYVHGVSNPAPYFRRLPYLNFDVVGDHKIIWELNRHQHLVTLAQAWLLTARRSFLDEITAQLEQWWKSNPMHRGINWSSALEVAFRVLSWIHVYQLAGPDLSAEFRARLVTGIYRHGRHLDANLSVYFSPNTHLLGEAVALHAIGVLFPDFPESTAWRRKAGRIVKEEMNRQVHSDGSHFEQSSYYHVYATDMFAFHAILEETDEHYRAKLARMTEYLIALLGPERRLAFMGDDDGGRLFHPYGPRDRFGRATVALCAAILNRPEWLTHPADLYEMAVWWLGPRVLDMPASQPVERAPAVFFPDAGIAVLQSGRAQVIFDGGPFGVGSGGHSHSDTLSIVVRHGTEDVLIDPGTFTYLSDPVWRERFRSTAAHNTVRAQGRDQAIPVNPFRWTEKPEVEVLHRPEDLNAPGVSAVCRYGGIRHHRTVQFAAPDTLIVFDLIEVDSSELQAEQFWHPARILSQPSPQCFEVSPQTFLSLAGPEQPVHSVGGEFGWRSNALGQKQEAPVIALTRKSVRRTAFGAAIRFDASPACVQVEEMSGDWQVILTDGSVEIARMQVDGRTMRPFVTELRTPHQQY